MKISKGKKPRAVRTVIYGTEGIGKSTLVSYFPQPLYIDTEDGTLQLDVNRFDEIKKWKDITDAVDYVLANDTICKTLVVDTADKAEQMLIDDILSKNKDKASIEDFGYGKGYTMIQERFQSELLNRLDKVIAHHINVVVVAHSIVKTITPPDSDPYDHWELKCSRKVSPILKEWADMLLFCNWSFTVVQDDFKKGKALGAGKRVIYANHKSQYDAKNRYGLPDEMPLKYESIKAVIEGQIEPQPVKDQLNVDMEVNSIVEGGLAESAIEHLRREITKAGMDVSKVEEWLRKSERIAPDGTIEDLAENTANSMIENIETLKNAVSKEKE